MNILQLEEVVKTYDKTVAVDHVSFSIPKGRVFGLLGPNGAGKTSLIRIITSITRADSGQLFFDGEPLRSIHSERIGYMPEERGLYKKMKVGEQLLYLAQLKGLEYRDARDRLRQWMTRFEIMSWWNKKVDELSKGMQQKVQFISTVVHEPDLLILDEPFSGLDPINTNLIKSEIRELNRKGISIIFSTHRMEQVEEMCEEIVLINKGRNVLTGEVKEIRERFKENIFSIEYSGNLPVELDALDFENQQFSIISKEDHSLRIKVEQGGDSNDLLRFLIQKGVHIISFKEVLPTINDIFIRVVEGDKTRDEE
jgi:ABC-2 type transport system ATP-binding protein